MKDENYGFIPKLIGLTGTQGCGKSTLMEAIKNNNYINGKNTKTKRVLFDDTKVSRKVQKEFGYNSLTEIEKSLKRIMKFQQAVLNERVRSLFDLIDKENTKEDDIVFTERSFIDVYAYTEFWVDKFIRENYVLDNKKISKYAMKLQYFKLDCFYYQSKFFHSKGQIFIRYQPNIKIDEDKKRADSSFARYFDFFLCKTWHEYVHYIQRQFNNHIVNLEHTDDVDYESYLLEIDNLDINHRLAQVLGYHFNVGILND